MVDEFALEHDSLILADHGPVTNRVKKQANMFLNLAISFSWIFQQGCILMTTSTVQVFCVFMRLCCIVCGNKIFHMG